VSAVPVEFDAVESMPEGGGRALRHLLVACADTKLLLGYHYGEWTFGTPELEAAVASCSLSQAELGHVRLLHAVLKAHCGDDPDALVERRPAEQFAAVGFLDRPIGDWAGFVAMNAVVDLALARVLHAMRGSSFKPLRMSVDKMLEEERYHVHHGRGWFRTMAARGGETRRALQVSVEAALASVAEWLGPPDEPEDRVLVAAGVKTMSGEAILAAIRNDLADLASECGMTLGPDRPVAFDGWDPATRRAGAGGPDEEILFHLRGSQNEMFKLG
jgi:ring-1,2-phenylacetyl-CoA epoxidase subunit PaaC